MDGECVMMGKSLFLFLVNRQFKGDVQFRVVGHIFDCFEPDNRSAVDDWYFVVAGGGLSVHHGSERHHGLSCAPFSGADGPVPRELFDGVITAGGPGAGNVLNMPWNQGGNNDGSGDLAGSIETDLPYY